MILIPFIGLMAKFSTLDRDLGNGFFFNGFLPLALFPSCNASYALVRVLSRKISNVPTCQCPAGGYVESQPVIKLCCQEMRQQLRDWGIGAPFQAVSFPVMFLTGFASSAYLNNIFFSSDIKSE